MALRIHYIINARIPHIRAYGIQIAKMSEALIEAGAEITLVIPKTEASKNDVQTVHGLREPVRTVVLPGLDWSDKGKILFLIGPIVFMIASYLYVRRNRHLIDVLYTIDMDTFSYTLLPLTGVPVVAEMHGAKRNTLPNRFFFARVSKIISTNNEIATALKQTFSLSSTVLTVEPNGVDEREYVTVPDKTTARTMLGLPNDARIALYAGRFYNWKGLDILPRAAAAAPTIQWYIIGGSEAAFKSCAYVEELPANVHVVGDQPPRDIPMWQAAADTLLILGTKKLEQSYRFTAPMKVYEYMIAQRPVVAARTPALTGIINQSEALFYEPDNAADLASVVSSSFTLDTAAMTNRAYQAAHEHTWLKRAERVLSFVQTI